MSRNSQKSTTPTQAHFSKVPGAEIPRSVFDRSSGYKSTFDSGYLIPFFIDEVLPGDTMKLNTSFLARLATPIFPYMDNVFMDFHYFFVPNRLVWENWERFNGSQDNPGDSTDFLVPQLDATTHAAGFGEGTLFDYLGLPTKVAAIAQANMPNALIPRAYNLIWNEWFRDENLQNSVDVDITDGPDVTSYTVLKRGRRKDYFTSALPFPQKGPAVPLPLGSTAPIYGQEVSGSTPSGEPIGALWSANGNGVVRNFGFGTASTSIGFAPYGGGPSPADWPGQTVDRLSLTLGTKGHYDAYNASIAPSVFSPPYADLSEATAATINELRQAFQIQRMFERDARGGTRYIEILLSHFGVVSPDFRLQRPEYLGGGSVPVNVNPVAQTSQTDPAQSPQGNLAAFATASGRNGFNHSFVEHGHVIGLVSVRADLTYQQGLNRMWSRQTRFDFYWPTLSHLGEQAVLNKEIYMDGSPSDNLVFAYQERYAEYRFRPSQVTGLFRSNAVASLDTWHLAMDFGALPTLAGLVEENPPIDRIIATPSEPQFIFDSYTSIRHARPMPTYSVPGLIDHF